MTPNIPGADDVVAFFGEWPSFHDAEVMTFHIDRESKHSFMRIRVFRFSSQIDSKGYYLKDRDALVRFEFTGIRSLRIEGEHADAQDVIFGLTIEQVNDAYRLELEPCYGLSGELVVSTLAVSLESTFDRRS